ncbi:MAG: DOPA 4,5-dioxygenase family protein [Azospirillaceae bacterium]
MADPTEPAIADYHAHVYFDADTVDAAEALCLEAAERFPLTMGRVHRKNVGPHPRWSCQLLFGTDIAGEVIGWLALNRSGLTVFLHPNTGDDIADHTDHAIWMGELLPLDLDALR